MYIYVVYFLFLPENDAEDQWESWTMSQVYTVPATGSRLFALQYPLR